VITGDLDEALSLHPELVAYSRYDLQLAPWQALYGAQAILTLRLEDMKADPQGTLDRVAAHLGRPGAFQWRDDLGAQNVSAERIRKFPLYDLLIEHPIAATLRRTLAPRWLRAAIKGRLQMRDRPEPTEASHRRLAKAVAEGAVVWRAAKG
jgi:hypothetical protein